MGRTKIQITLADLEPLFQFPIKEAADRLHMSKTTLKQRCRELHLPSWPFKRKYGKGSADEDGPEKKSAPEQLSPMEVPEHKGAFPQAESGMPPAPSQQSSGMHPEQQPLPPPPPPHLGDTPSFPAHSFAPLPRCVEGMLPPSSDGPFLLTSGGVPYMSLAAPEMPRYPQQVYGNPQSGFSLPPPPWRLRPRWGAVGCPTRPRPCTNSC
eukprot:GAFH01004794.1.p1 GENE.GAFH01004794.1~~GAFH01004794.1.p1  ORF type:complete len:209 (+),score=1.91 GAFH01004794.1:15-641(+)